MIDAKALVNDFLLKELSIETKKIGTKVLVKKNGGVPEYTADIVDVIVIPQSEFYRAKFMRFYKIYNYNSVKALKELANNFSFTPDYELGIGYILNVSEAPAMLTKTIKIKSELQVVQNSRIV